MRDEEIRLQIHRIMDTRLSEMNGNPYLAQRVMQQATGKRAMRRKISIGLVVVVFLILTGAVALAVYWSARDFVQQVIAPLSQNTDQSTWTSEEVERVIQLAQENGIEVSPEMREGLHKDASVFKEELMRQFVKLDYGFYPASWPVEEQAWYDELLVEYGLKDQQTRFIPEEGEIQEEEALRLAQAYIKTRWNKDVSSELYTHYVQYMLTEDGNGTLCKRWDIEFEDATGELFRVMVTPDGNIVEEDSIHRMPLQEDIGKENLISPSVEEVLPLLYQDDFYTVENLAYFVQKYSNLLTQIQENGDESLLVLRQLLMTPYALPSPGEISSEEAMQCAIDTALTQGWTEEWLSWCRYSISYRQYEDEPAYYRICFKLKLENRQLFYQRGMPFGIVVYIEPKKAQTMNVVILNELDDFERYCEFPDVHDVIENPGVG